MYTIDLSGQVALVTGSSRGIGAAIAKELAAAGASVGINYRTNANAADRVIDEIRAAGARPCGFPATYRTKTRPRLWSRRPRTGWAGWTSW